MPTLIPLMRAALLVPVLVAYGSALDEQRLDDRTTTLPIDRAMDARLTAYVPLVGPTERCRAHPDEILRVAALWREGRRSERLRDPMPARYGEDEEGAGARDELIHLARAFASRSLYRAEGLADRALARRIFAAALEPLRTVQYADVATLEEVARFVPIFENRMRRAGFRPDEIRRTSAILRVDPERRAELYRQMRRLRAEFRARHDDPESLRDADPRFERIVREESKRTRFVARR